MRRKKARISIVNAALILLLLVANKKAASFETVLCTFDDGDPFPCSFSEANFGTFSLNWQTIVARNATAMQDFPPVDSQENADGYYAFLNLNNSRYVPMVGYSAAVETRLLSTDDSAKCVNFQYYFYGQLLTKFQLLRTCFQNSTTMDIKSDYETVMLWQNQGWSTVHGKWYRKSIRLNDQNLPLDQCYLSFRAELYKNKEIHGSVLLDQISVDSCEKLESDLKTGLMCDFEHDSECPHWDLKRRVLKADISTIQQDATWQSGEGHFSSVVTDSCGYFRLAERTLDISSIISSKHCFFFKTQLYRNEPGALISQAELYVHITDGFLSLDTPWGSAISSEIEYWQSFYASFDSSFAQSLTSNNLTLILEAYLCSSNGNVGLAIDDLTKIYNSPRHCRLLGDDDFELPSASHWVPVESPEHFNFIGVNLDQKGTFARTNNDHSFTKNYPITGRAMFSDDHIYGDVARLESIGLLAPTKARCVNFWFTVGNVLQSDMRSQLWVFVKNLKTNDLEPDIPEDERQIQFWHYFVETMNKDWLQASFTYHSTYHHKLMFESFGGFGLDDISFTDGFCKCAPAYKTDCAINAADLAIPSLKLLHDEFDRYYSRVGDCKQNNVAVYHDIDLYDCERKCANANNGRGCPTFVYDQSVHKCEIKSSKCVDLLTDGDEALSKIVYEFEEVPGFYGHSGTCPPGASQSSMFSDVTTVDDCVSKFKDDANAVAFEYARVEKLCWILKQPCVTMVQHDDRKYYELIDQYSAVRYAGGCQGQGKTTILQKSDRVHCVRKCLYDQCYAASFNAQTLECTEWFEEHDCTQKRIATPSMDTYVMTSSSSDCNFEPTNDFACGTWENDRQNDFNFRLVTVNDGFAMNGPKRDVTFGEDGQGRYVMTEAPTLSEHVNGKSIFRTRPGWYSGKDITCFSFWYYIFGTTPVSITVSYVLQNLDLQVLWSWPIKTADGSFKPGPSRIIDSWQHVQLNVQQFPELASNQFQLVIEVRRNEMFHGSVAFDDIRASQQACLKPYVPTCDFDGVGSCEALSSSDMEIFKVLDVAKMMKPQDVTYGSPTGHVIGSSSLAPNEPAYFTFSFNGREDRCLVFWYQIGSECIGLMAAETNGASKFSLPIVQQNVSPLGVRGWQKAMAHLPGGTKLKREIYVEARTICPTKAGENFVFIDQVEVLEHGCQRSISCNFENDMACSMFDLPFDSNPVPDWIQGQIPQLGRGRLPAKDATLLTVHLGGYLLAQGNLGQLVTLALSQQQLPLTLTFQYMIVGPHSGVLEVLLYDDELGQGLLLWHLALDSNNLEWHYARIPINETFFDSDSRFERFRIVFEAHPGSSNYALIALDDIYMLEGIDGDFQPYPNALPSTTLTTPAPYSTTTPVTPYPPIEAGRLLSCNFDDENADCSFVASPSEGKTWHKVCGPACSDASQQHGPFNDHTTGSDEGRYWLLSLGESFFGGTENIPLDLYRILANESGTYCMSFWYWSEGSNVPRFEFTFTTNSQTDPYWQRTGSQGSQWNYVEVDLEFPQVPVNPQSWTEFFRFTGTRTPSSTGYMALDDIIIYDTMCPQRPLECTFDAAASGKTCGSELPEDPKLEATWNLGTLFNPSDHTLRVHRGRMAYVTTKTFFRNSFGPVQMVQPYPSLDNKANTNQYCLQYWYKFKLGGTGKLRFLMQDQNKIQRLVTETNENDGIEWAIHEADVTGLSGPQWLIVEATYDYDEAVNWQYYNYVVMVDDIKFLPHACEKLDTCTFENGNLCGWENEDEISQFDWLVGSGQYAGPLPLDHTYKDLSGHYLFVEWLAPRKIGEIARFERKEISGAQDGQGCLTFWFLNNVMLKPSALRLLAKLSTGGEITLWFYATSTGDLKSWTSAVVSNFNLAPINRHPFTFVFEATFDDLQYGGVLAIDDIRFQLNNTQGCAWAPAKNSVPETSAQLWGSCSFSSDFCFFQPYSTLSSSAWTIKTDTIDNINTALFSYSTKIVRSFTGYLATRQLAGSGNLKYCLSFEFAFHGIAAGIFRVYFVDTAEPMREVDLYRRYNTQGYFYSPVKVNVFPTVDFRLFVQTAQGNGSLWDGVVSLRKLNFEKVQFSCDYFDGSTTTCNFEDGCAGWIPNPADVSPFRLASDQSFPSRDHTYQTNLGHYYLATYKGPNSGQLGTSTLTTPQDLQLNGDGEKCLTFWYYRFATNSNDMPNLFVQIFYSNVSGHYPDQPNTPWSDFSLRTDLKLHDQWTFGQVGFPKNNFVFVKLSFVADLRGPSAIVAIDDIKVSSQPCGKDIVDCDFESSTCGYDNVGDSWLTSNLDWLWIAPVSKAGLEGPAADHTFGSARGHYLLVEGSMFDQEEEVVIQSPNAVNNVQDDGCIEFWYYIADVNELNLNVSVHYSFESGQSETDPTVRMFSKPTNRTWIKDYIPLIGVFGFGMSRFHLRFTAWRSSKQVKTGYIAVDDIKLRWGFTCEQLSGTTTMVPPTTTPAPVPISNLSCSFDQDFCLWQNAGFYRATGVIPSAGTYSPNGGVSGVGYYIHYGDGSSSSVANGSAVLNSTEIPFSSEMEQVCLRFWFHLAGPNVKSLNVYQANLESGVSTPVWTRLRDQGTRWIQTQVQIPNIGSRSQIRFEATKDIGSKGVIAIDNVEVFEGRCSPLPFCDFEEPGLCGWFNDPTIVFSNWTLAEAGTNSKTGGPSQDHSTGASSGHYMWHNGNSHVSLISPMFKLSDETIAGCIRLWLWTSTASLPGTLNVQIAPSDMNDQPLVAEAQHTFARIEHFENPNWYQLRQTFRLNTTRYFRLKLNIAGDGTSNQAFAIDDVEVDLRSPCDLCDFEKGSCGWQPLNGKTNAALQWRQSQGPSMTPGTGPRVDHTLGLEFGSFLYLDSSDSKAGSLSEADSQIFSVYQFRDMCPSCNSQMCLRFWYHMYGAGMGTLKMWEPRNGKVYLEVSGNQGNQWLKAQSTLVAWNNPTVLRLTAIIGTPGVSDMAIDDLELLPGSCDLYDGEGSGQKFYQCLDGKTQIASTKRCDFVPDCPLTADDESNCGFSCNFDPDQGMLEQCAWYAFSTSNQRWLLGTNSQDNSGMGPPTDATSLSHSGGFLYVAPNPSSTTSGFAEFRIDIAPTPDSCRLELFFQGGNMAPTLGVDFSIALLVGDETTTLLTERFNGAYFAAHPFWQLLKFKLGRIHTHFTISIRAKKDQVTAGYFGIDGVSLLYCQFPMPKDPGDDCEAGQFQCIGSGACVNASQVCDLSDDCGDGSDEAADCSYPRLPAYCNFERGDCGFKVANKYWGITTGYYDVSKGPGRDHTTGLDYGHFFRSDKNDVEPFNVLRFNQALYVTPKTGDCSMKFYYQLLTFDPKSPESQPSASELNSLLIELVRETPDGNFSTPITLKTLQEDTPLGEWVREEVTVTPSLTIPPSTAFTFQFTARNVTRYVAIDDVTMTEGCLVGSSELCLAPDYYRCKGSAEAQMPCIKSKFVGDYIVDCPNGDDERGFGPCSFEPGVGYDGSSDQWCGWQSDSESGFNLVHIGQGPVGAYDPVTDGPPTLNTTGWVIEARPKAVLKAEPSVFKSPILPPMASSCQMKFAFYVNGVPNPHEQYLVTVSNGEVQTSSMVVSLNTSKWNTRKYGIFTSEAGTAKSQVRVTITPSLDRNEAILAIDNFAFEHCSPTRELPELGCSFDTPGDTCRWKINDPEQAVYNAKVEWRFGNGSQTSTLGGPASDYSGKGYYLFVSNFFVTSGNFFQSYYAQLTSPWFDENPQPYCVSFAYNIFGSSPGSLRVILFEDDNSGKEQFARTVSQGDQWYQGQFMVPVLTRRYYIMFYAYTSRSNIGHIALDEIGVKLGECPSPAICDFEQYSSCGWTSQADGSSGPYDFTWQRIRRIEWNHVPESGAPIDRTTESNLGYFMNFEAAGKLEGQKAGLKSPAYQIPLKDELKCFAFWYHMWGKDVGTLSINLLPAPLTTRRIFYSRTGNHGNHWWHGKIDLKLEDFSLQNTSGWFSVLIEGVRGSSDLSDMAIDDAGVTDGPCPAEGSCSFEQDECGFANMFELNTVGMSWVRMNNQSGGVYQGPPNDHTLGNPLGYSMVVTWSQVTWLPLAAYYATEVIEAPTNKAHCLSFWYRMVNTQYGTLSVFLLNPATPSNWLNGSKTVWSKSGNQKDAWLQVETNIIVPDNQLEYAAIFSVTGDRLAYDGYIAVDDVKIDKTGPCLGQTVPTVPPTPQMFYPCGFERGDCGFTVEEPMEPSKRGAILWQVATGAAKVRPDAPASDHTKGDATGRYFASFLNGSDTSWYRVSNISSIALSPLLETDRRHCKVTGYYSVSNFTSKQQSLRIGIQQFPRKNKIFFLAPNITVPTYGWVKFQFDIGYQPGPFQIFLWHTIDFLQDKAGMLAFDDLSYLDCSPPEPPSSPPQCDAKHEFQCVSGACIPSQLVCDGTDDCLDSWDPSQEPGSDEFPERCADRLIITMENVTQTKLYLVTPKPNQSPYDPVDYVWGVKSGQSCTSTYGNTGPTFDHTYGNSTGRYYLAENNYPYLPYNHLWLKFYRPFAGLASGTFCELRFAYHMYGTETGTFNVLTRNELGGDLKVIWSRTGAQANFWLRGSVQIRDSPQEFEIIFELVTKGRYGDLGLDDISLTEHCKFSDAESLPVASTTPRPSTTPIPTCDEDPTKLSCGVVQPCIDLSLVCNFVNDCADGRDETFPVCIRNPSYFNTSDLDGWFPEELRYSWQWIDLSNPKTIPPSLGNTAPLSDYDGRGFYLLADSNDASYSSERAELDMLYFYKGSGAQCHLQFGYIVTSAGTGSGSLELYQLTPRPGGAVAKRLWSAAATSSRDWRKGSVHLGKLDQEFLLEFSAVPAYQSYLPAYAAIDAVEFIDCEMPEPSESCEPQQFRCVKAGTCLKSKELACDFTDHCGDGFPGVLGSSSDEDPLVCQAYPARCAFDQPAADCSSDWFNELVPVNPMPWRIIQVAQANSRGYPPTDHTLGTDKGHVLMLQYSYQQVNFTGRYVTSKRYLVSRQTDHCSIRFYLYLMGSLPNKVGTLELRIRTSYPDGERVLAVFDEINSIWMYQHYTLTPGLEISLNQPFEFILQGRTNTEYYSSGFALDDISLTPDCHETLAPLPGQSSATTTPHAPVCSDLPGQFQCASGGKDCYSLVQHCNFEEDCPDGSDEWGCTESLCDFDNREAGNTTYWCNWSYSCQATAGGSCLDVDKARWKSAVKVSGNSNLPSCDYTSGNCTGAFLYAGGGLSINDKSLLSSAVFEDSSPECSLKFAYYAYNYQAQYDKPSKLTVFAKSSKGRQVLFEGWQTYPSNWKTVNVSIYVHERFEVQFEVTRGSSYYPEIAIDGLEFQNCTPSAPAAQCVNPRDFLCSDRSRCIPQNRVCDFTPDCRDGSDEDETYCFNKRSKGSCTFETGDWQSVCSLAPRFGGDLAQWGVEEASKLGQKGPAIDHTQGSGKGKVAFLNTSSEEDLNSVETASLATETLFPSNVAGTCLVRFYYYFYRAKTSQGVGRLKVVTVDKTGNHPSTLASFTLGNIPAGTSTEDLNSQKWQWVSVQIARSEPYKVLIQAETDDNPLSIIALDDLSFSEGCRQGSDGSSTQPSNATCSETEIFCESEKTCIYESWICDGWCDCPSLGQNLVCVDEDGCSEDDPETTGLPDRSTREPFTPKTTTTKKPTDGSTLDPEHPDDPEGQTDLGLIIGLSIGGFVVLLAFSGAVVFYVLRKRKIASNVVQGARQNDLLNFPILDAIDPEVTSG